MDFELKATFNTTPVELFAAWLNSEGRSSLLGKPAEASDKVGELFKDYDGYITGKNIEIDPHKRIIQSWRAAEFTEKDEDSEVEFLFEEVSTGVELTIIHRHVPDALCEQYKKGWEDFYFKPMRSFFS